MPHTNPHTLVWMDIPVQDLDRAMTFYRQVLDRDLDDYRPHQPMAVIRHPAGSVSCALLEHPDEAGSQRGPLVYFNCDGRLDPALGQVRLNGGRVIRDRHDIAPFGHRAIVLDSEGNRIALHSSEG